MKKIKAIKMFDKINPEYAHGAMIAISAFIVSILTSLSDGKKRSWKADIVEALTCSFFSLAGLSFVIAMGWNIYFSVVICVFISSLGSKKIKRLASDFVNKKVGRDD